MKLLEELTTRHKLSIKRLNAMTGITTKRLAELHADQKPTRTELHQLETIKRFACICSHGLNFDDEIKYQENQVSLIEQEIRKHLLKFDPETEETIMNFVKGLESECKYLGCFLADNNQEELVYKSVRQSRKVKGTENVR